MNKLTAITEEFSSQGSSNVKGEKTGSLVVAEIPAFSLPIGSAIEFKFGGVITGNKTTSNDKLQLIPHIPGVGNAAPFVLFDKALSQASNFQTTITISCVEDSAGNPRVEWLIKTNVGKDTAGYEEIAITSNLAIGQTHGFQFFMQHTKSQENSKIDLKYCYVYSI